MKASVGVKVACCSTMPLPCIGQIGVTRTWSRSSAHVATPKCLYYADKSLKQIFYLIVALVNTQSTQSSPLAIDHALNSCKPTLLFDELLFNTD